MTGHRNEKRAQKGKERLGLGEPSTQEDTEQTQPEQHEYSQFLTAQKLFSEKLSVSRPEINQRIISLLKT